MLARTGRQSAGVAATRRQRDNVRTKCLRTHLLPRAPERPTNLDALDVGDTLGEPGLVRQPLGLLN